MANSYFRFKQFTIHQDRCAMKVTTDGCLFGAWVADQLRNKKLIAKDEKLVDNVLDIGAGTGLLSLMLTQGNSNVLIDAIEIDKGAYEQAIENIAASPWPQQINAVHGNAREFFFTKQYDVIISNPPFYENELRSSSSTKNKAHHDEGLLFDDLLALVKKNLSPKGEFYLLLPYKRNKEIENAMAKKELVISHKALVKQSTQHHYFRLMISGKHRGNGLEDLAINEITIRDEKQEYTPEFIHLLKDYYLHL